MKTSIKSVFKLCIAAMLLLFISCNKEGPEGPQGEQGIPGEQGSIGIPGKNGAVILNGTGTPAANLGNKGDMYLDKSTTNLYGPKSASGWGIPLSLKGNSGLSGANGDKGDKGDTGATGAKGDKGDKGDTGATGAKGDKGDKGDTGATGAKGDKGDKGDTGATGAKGDKGDKGAKGATGAAGSQILKGIKAPLTSTGNIGDYYLNTTTGDLYGPKTNTLISWGIPINLKGTANVVSTTWKNIERWDLLPSTAPIVRKSIDVPTPIANAVGYPSLAELMHNGGVFLLYIKTTPGGEFDHIYLLPGTAKQYGWQGDYRLTLRSPHYSDQIILYLTTESPGIRNDPSLISYRYVLIPAGRQMSAVRAPDGRQISVDQLKKMNYQEAASVLGWKD